MKLEHILKHNRVIGLIGDVNTAKSMTLYNLINYSYKLNKNINIYAYGLRNEIKGVKPVYSVAELEQIKSSLIIIDELSSLFDLEYR